LNPIGSSTKVRDVEKYCALKNLRLEPEINQFLKIRFTILLRSYDKFIKDNECGDSSENVLFIKRLIHSEAKQIKYLIDYLS
jgi:hypothetical protein